MAIATDLNHAERHTKTLDQMEEFYMSGNKMGLQHYSWETTPTPNAFKDMYLEAVHELSDNPVFKQQWFWGPKVNQK